MNNPDFNHVACYLPFKPRIKWYRQEDSSFQTSELTVSDYPFFKGKMYKLILHPLSDWCKKIQIAEHFMSFADHVERINPSTKDTKACAVMDDGSIELHFYRDYQFLFEHHFDVFGLIEAGKAIDINTIK
jgi:hypothetical protein